MPRIVPVVLCGGAGARLAPLSRPDRPKPLLPLGPGGRTLLADTLDRFRVYAPPWLVCGRAHAGAMAAEAGPVALLVEPVPRGTAAAAVAGALLAEADDVVLVTPADHAVDRPDALCAAIDRAATSARERIVTFGIHPTRADTGYGWIRPGRAFGAVREVEAFVEKPDPVRAAALRAGGWLWNSGLFLVRAGLLLDEARRLVPGLVEAVSAAVASRLADVLGAPFADAPAGSLDVLVMEKTPLAAVAPVDCGWSDLGTWEAVRAQRGDAFVDDLLRSA